VTDQDDLGRAERALANRERTNLVICHDAARIPDHVRLALPQAENGENVEPGVHAGDDGYPRRWAPWQLTGEGLGVPPVVLEESVSLGHG